VQAGQTRRALIVAGGDVSATVELDPDLLRSAGAGDLLVIAADGGLHNAEALGLHLDLVVGDGDSLAPGELEDLSQRGIEVQLHPRSKDSTDTELAIREAVRRGAAEVTLIGALGGLRFDHALANVLLLAALDIGAALVIVDGPTTIRVIGRRAPERLNVDGAVGDILSLLPLSEETTGVSVTGCAYPLDQATLAQGSTLGLSNELLSPRAAVAVERGRLAVMHTRKAVDS
jgi:thiamine pyrophosphokinase